MGKLLTLLNSLSKPVTGIDAAQLASDLAKQSISRARLADVLKNYLLTQDSLFMIFFDDTDQVASPDNAQHLNRIWGLLLALRKLTSSNPNIKCVVTLRTEVWMRLIRNEQGQRDQIDHFRPLVLFLRAPETHINSIFQRRIALAAVDDGYLSNFALEYFFDGQWMQLPTSDERRTWSQFLLKSSRERPRDMIQLVNHLANEAKSRASDTIGSIDAETGMEKYSRERAEDLGIEMGFDCPSFLSVIRTFADVPFECDFVQLRFHLKSIPSRFSLIVNGRALKPGDDDDAITLLALVHESGLMNARIPDTRQTLGYRHITFLDDPHLVQMSRWNELQSATWEIHPAFRTFIISLQRERSWRST
jgi:hypothetical protein